MMKLKKRSYPLEYAMGINEMLSFFLDSEYSLLLNTIQILLISLKFKIEGFRVNIFIFILGKFLFFITGYQIISSLLSVLFVFSINHLVVYELPNGGPPVGHQWFNKDKLSEFGLEEMSIFYPAEVTDHKLGYKWLKTRDYAGRMNDTIKKDNRPSKRNRYTPKLFFQVVCTQFYKFSMNIYEKAFLKDQPKYPIIIFSHGLANHCDGQSVYTRFLAQQGYIVFCPEHHEQIRNIKPTDEENRLFRIEQLMKRYETIQRILDIIYSPESFNKFMIRQDKEKVILPDYDNISIIGHSFGGSTAIYTSYNDSRITGACIAYDPAMYVFEDGLCTLIGSRIQVPCLSINSSDFYERLYSFMENDKRLLKMFSSIHSGLIEHSVQLYINDQQHADFSDLPLIWCGEAKLYGLSRKLDEIHFRTEIILSLTKTFLLQAEQYRMSKLQGIKNGFYKQENLKSLLVETVRKDINEDGVKLIRWTQ